MERWRDGGGGDDLTSSAPGARFSFCRCLSLLVCLVTVASVPAASRFSVQSASTSNGTVGGQSKYSAVTAVGIANASSGQPSTNSLPSKFAVTSGNIGAVSFATANPGSFAAIQKVLGTNAVGAAPVSYSSSLVGAMTFDAQSGLVRQRIRIQNTWITSGRGTVLLVDGLPAGYELDNRSGISNGVPFIEFAASLGVGSQLEMLLEFSGSGGNTSWLPLLTALADDGRFSEGVSGQMLAVGRVTGQGDGTALVEFTGVPGAQYQIQYSTDLSNWFTANGIVTASGQGVSWLDSGPPTTASLPGVNAMRYYRIGQVIQP